MDARDELGAFAPAHGALEPAIAVAIGASGLSVILAGLYPVLDAADIEANWMAPAGLATAGAAVLAALVGVFRAEERGRWGRALGKPVILASVGAGLFVYLYGAIHGGSIRLDNLADWVDPTVLRAVAPDLARGAVNTLKAAATAEVLAIIVGLVIATLSLSPRKLARRTAVAYVDVVRGLPLVMLALLIYYATPSIGITLGPFVGLVVILTVNASAYIAEIFRAGIQSVPRGQMDAARSLGMPHASAMLHIVIPQAVRSVIPPLVSEFIALVKDTALVIFVIGFTATTRDISGAARQTSASTFSIAPLFGAAVMYLLITIPTARIVGRVERRLRVGLA